MIARVTMGPALIRSLTPATQPEDLAEFVDLHVRLTDLLLGHCKCVYGSKTDDEEIHKAIHELAKVSPDAGKRWRVALDALKKTRRAVWLTQAIVPDLDHAASVEQLAGWKGKVAVAAVPAVQAARLGVASTAASWTDPATHVEITKAKLLGRSSAMYRCISMATGGVIPHGSDRDAFFDDILAPLVHEARVIEICDGYLFSRLQRRNHASTAPPEHVGWLLDRIAASPSRPAKRVRLLGGSDRVEGPVDSRAAADLVRQHWGRSRDAIGAIEVVSVPWRNRGDRLPHDRHIAFDVGASIEIPAGFDRFARRTVEDRDGVRWMYNPMTSSSFKKTREERTRVRKAANDVFVTV